MANLSQIKRDQMIDFLRKLRELHNDDEALIAFNQIENELTSKKYGLVWEKHEEEVDVKMHTHIPVFSEDVDREISASESNSFNFILEGDNLHSLRLLEKTHKGRVDVIYIDPPYNTGNEDFIYDDKYIDSDDTYRHSLWLSFMESRLKKGFTLLRDQGVIFISIDENEYANLKLLCDELFSPKNYIATYFWKKTDTPPSLSNKVRKKYEYILCYGKNVDSKHSFSQGLIDGDDAPLLNTGNPYKKVEFPVGSVHFNIADGTYKHVDSMKIHLVEPVIVKNGINTNKMVAEGTWKWKQETINDEVKEGTYFLVKSKQFSVRYQRKDVNKVKVPQNNINDEVGVGTNEDSAKEIKSIFGISGMFDYAKPVSLIKFLIKMTNKNDDILVLDFFAGSGTTGQAVLELNDEIGGSRKFILCTDNTKSIDATGDYLHSKGIVGSRPQKSHQAEYKKWRNEVKEYYSIHKNEFVNTVEYDLYGIAQRITFPRIKTVILGRREDGSIYSDGIRSNLKYYKTDFVDKNSDELYDDLLEHIVEMIQLQFGIKVDNRRFVVIMDDDEMDDFEKNIQSYTALEAVFVNQEVLLSTSQEKLLEGIDTYIIPNCYFDFELREAGEIW